MNAMAGYDKLRHGAVTPSCDMSPDSEKLCTQYENGRMAVWTYSRALLDFRKHRESPTCKEYLHVQPECPVRVSRNPIAHAITRH